MLIQAQDYVCKLAQVFPHYMENYQIKDAWHFAQMANLLIIRQENVQLAALLHLYSNTLIIQHIYAYNIAQLNQIIFHKIKPIHAFSHVLVLLQCLLTIQPEDV